MKGEEKLSTQYNDAVKQIKTAILQSQAKALKGVNQEQLALYYGIGRFISQNSRAGFWGKDAIDTISRQLSTEVPGLRGFSPRNLRNMRMFYEEWKCLDTNLADASAKLDSEGKLAAYLRVLDDEEQIEGENPSVGIVLCKDADRDEFLRRDDATAFSVTH